MPHCVKDQFHAEYQNNIISQDFHDVAKYSKISSMYDLKTLKIQYLEHLEIEKNRSVKTLENYGRYLNRFFAFARSASSKQANFSSPAQIDDEIVRQYRLYLNRISDSDGRTLKKVTQNYHIIALRNFLKYLAKRGVRSLTAERVELGRQEQREVTFLEPEELDRLLNAPVLFRSENSRKDKNGGELASLRDAALLHTLFSTGMRVSELCSLDRDKIDTNRGEVTIRGKGGKLRLVFLSDYAKDALKNYLNKRTDVDESLFARIPKGKLVSAETLRLTPRSIQRIVKKHAIKAGIMGKSISPHSLRHSMATDLLRNGADIRSVQAMLGHSSVTTTQIYTHVTDKQLREVHQRFHNKKKN